LARDGSGNFSLPEAAFVYDTVISETAVNSNFSDIATALTASIAKDGQTNPTANLPMATYRHTGVGNASARTDYAAAGQVQDATLIWCGTAGGTNNALTFSPTPSIPAYVTGQRFRFQVGAAASDSTVTIAVSGLTAKAAQVDDAALSASVVLDADKYYDALYDGTAFQLTRLSPSAAAGTPTTTRGDLIRRGASADERVALGADNTLLASDGTDPAWETLTSLLDGAISSTQGVVLYRGASAWAALAVGTSGQVLQTLGAAANPAWATNYGWEYVGAVTASGGTSVVLGEGNLASGYDYQIRVETAKNSADSSTGTLKLQFGTGGTPTYQTTGYINQHQSAVSTTIEGVRNATTGGIAIHAATTNLGGGSAGETWSAEIDVRVPAANTIHRVKTWMSANNSSGTTEPILNTGTGWRTTAEVVTGLRIILDGVITIDSGEFTLFRRRITV
jgi:hypothetical protein